MPGEALVVIPKCRKFQLVFGAAPGKPSSRRRPPDNETVPRFSRGGSSGQPFVLADVEGFPLQQRMPSDTGLESAIVRQEPRLDSSLFEQ